MKILLGVPEYPPYHVGGGGEVFKQLAENYKKLGHEVVVIYGYYLASSWNEEIKEYKENDIKFYQIPEIPYFRSKPFLKTVMPPNPKAWFKLKNIIKKENPDVAHLHGYGFVFIDRLAKSLNKAKINYVYTLHGAPVTPEKVKGLIWTGYSLYKPLFGNKTLKNAKEITAVSKYSTTFPEFKHYKNKIIVINNGLDFSKYNKKNKKFGNNSEIIFLSLGRIEWLKGFQYFIKIIPRLMQNGFNIKYLIGGRDNGYKGELDSLISEYNLEKNVFYLGFLEFNKKIEALNNSDFVVIPSLIENFPAVPLEAMALGKIPIVNNAGGMPEIVNSGHNGILVNVENENEFYMKIKEILVDKKLRENMIKNLSEVKKYDWRNISKSYLKLMENIMEVPI